MLQRVIRALKDSPFGEIFRRFVIIYRTMDTHGKRVILVVQAVQITSILMNTFAVGSIAVFLIILSKPKIITDNHYLAMAYRGFGFSDEVSFLLIISGLLVLFMVAQQILTWFFGILRLRLLDGVHRRCLVMLYRYYLAEDYEWHIQRGTSSVIGKILISVRGIVNGEISRATKFISVMINIVFIVVALYVVSPQALFVLLAVIMVSYVGFFVAYRNKSRKLGEKMFKQTMRQISLIKDGATAAAEIKLMGKEREFVNEVNKSLVQLTKNRIENYKMNALPQSIMSVSGMIILYIIAAYVFLSEGAEHAFTTLTLFAAAAVRLLPSIQTLFSTVLNQESGTKQYKAIVEDLQAASLFNYDTWGDEPNKIVCLKDKVVFENVTYSYPGADHPAVKNLNFSLPAGKIVALFGHSGAGKTTLIRLLIGLLSPQQGRILVDGVSLQDDAQFKRGWQESLGIAFQRPFFMDASIALNIALEVDKQKVDRQRVMKAIELAHLRDLVNSLPQGLDTRVSEDAGILSGGQRQRLAIARTLYRSSTVLILDEATNSLDLVVEKKVLNSLIKEGKEKLIIMIAHRPDTMRFADIVLVMKPDGSLAQGSYTKLMKTDNDFRMLAGRSAQQAS